MLLQCQQAAQKQEQVRLQQVLAPGWTRAALELLALQQAVRQVQQACLARQAWQQEQGQKQTQKHQQQ